MLPPVLASPNSYVAAVESRPRPDQVSSRATAAVLPEAPAAISRETVAGQLNIMLLSAPERMSQNLAALAEVLGSALKIERASDESLTGYMGRLIAAIADLPAPDRLKLQKLLSQSFAGLQLRTLLEAMASPSGPERTTLALYLELYRQMDRDGAMRSVISSYRELASDGRSADMPPALRTAANDGGQRLPAKPLQDQKLLQQPPVTRLEGASVGRGTENSARPAASHLPGPSRPATALPSRLAAEVASSSLPAQARAAERPQSGNAIPLNRSAEPPSAGSKAAQGGNVPLSLPPPAVMAAGQQRASVDVEHAPDVSAERVAQPNDRDSRTTAHPTPSIPPSALVQMEARPVLPLPAAWLSELFTTDFVRALLQLKSLPASLISQNPMGGRPGSAEAAVSTPIPEKARLEEAADSADYAARLHELIARDPGEEPGLPPPTVLPDQALLRLAILREGLPLPFVSYLIDDDFEPSEVEEEEEQEASSQGEPEDERGRDPEDPPADSEDQGAVEGGLEGPAATTVTEASEASVGAPPSMKPALPSPSDEPLHLQVEPAQDLYLRMAGLI